MYYQQHFSYLGTTKKTYYYELYILKEKAYWFYYLLQEKQYR